MTGFTQQATIVAEIEPHDGMFAVRVTLICEGHVLGQRIVGLHAEHSTAAEHLIAIGKTLEDPYDDRPATL